MVPLAGALGEMFGVCCNELSADGRVVDFGYGCGAHSDTPAPPSAGSAPYDPYDDGVLEVIESAPPSTEPPAEPGPELAEPAVEAASEPTTEAPSGPEHP